MTDVTLTIPAEDAAALLALAAGTPRLHDTLMEKVTVPVERYCVIAPTAVHRTWCETVEQAVAHGTALLQRANANNSGNRLLVVRAVELLERETPVLRRALTAHDLTKPGRPARAARAGLFRILEAVS